MGSSRTATCHSLPHSSIIALWVTAFLLSHTTHVSGSADVSTATVSPVPRLRLAPPLNLTSVLASRTFARANPLEATPAGSPSPSKRYQLIAPARLSSPSFDITWHKGALYTAPITVNLIFYGNGWSKNQQNIVTDFFASFSRRRGGGGLPGLGQWWKILHAYCDGTGGVSRSVRLGSVVLDSNSVGNSLGSDSLVQRVVSNAIAGGHLKGSNPSELTHVLVSSDVAVEGFCVHFCGYHSMFSLGGREVAYGLLGLPPASGCDGCQAAFLPKRSGGNGWSPPNGDIAVDSLISAIAHETAETATDPDTQSGYFSDSGSTQGDENADFCAYYYGNVFSTNSGDSSPTAFNVAGVNGRKYLIQTNYDVVRKRCVNYC